DSADLDSTTLRRGCLGHGVTVRDAGNRSGVSSPPAAHPRKGWQSEGAHRMGCGPGVSWDTLASGGVSDAGDRRAGRVWFWQHCGGEQFGMSWDMWLRTWETHSRLSKFRRAVDSAVETVAGLTTATRLFVAVSGGKDGVALAGVC